jgi:uncharacterized protein YcfJ
MTASLRVAAVATTTLLLAACVTVPSGPSLQALPGSRKTYDQFVLDDGACRNVAVQRLGGRTPADAANDSAAASAVAGTAIGAVTGALIDGSSGAAAGAGIGLLFGAMAGTSAASSSYAMHQHQFDATYYGCMYQRGHKVPVPANAVAAYRARYGASPVLPPPGWVPVP